MIGIATAARRSAFAVALGLGVALAAGQQARAVDEVNVNDGYAVHGYDVVAYQTVGKPTEGSDQFTAAYQGATYRFASSAHRDAFKADPAKYAPQYGGYCAFGAAFGVKADGKPDLWTIRDGKLYLNLNRNVQQRFKADTEGLIRGADHNWPLIEHLAAAGLSDKQPDGITRGAQ